MAGYAAYGPFRPKAGYSATMEHSVYVHPSHQGKGIGRALLVAQQLSSKGQDQAFMQAKIATARFYAEHILVKAPAQRDAIVEGAASVTALALDAF